MPQRHFGLHGMRTHGLMRLRPSLNGVGDQRTDDKGEAAVVGTTDGTRRQLYAVRKLLGGTARKELGLTFQIDVYYKDPLVAAGNIRMEFDDDFQVPWEPSISAGPTSARFAVVDYDSTANTLAAPAKWDGKRSRFLEAAGKPVDRAMKNTSQFRQVSTWAIVQRALEYFESGRGLGRHILWGFEGNRLIVVPAAGYAQNAYYDRASKSLQFYYFDRDDGTRIYTCLSTDIVNHELGHAILDGIRPHLLESVTPQTAAFHEFIGDIAAILMALRNVKFRQLVADMTEGKLSGSNALGNVAAEFGQAVSGRPYLRSATNSDTMVDLAGVTEPHRLSEVMTGAMFDILIKLAEQYQSPQRAFTPRQAFAFASDRMQEIAIQALDFLPPVEATFRDYALAVLRNFEICNPADDHGYYGLMVGAFYNRGILDQADLAATGSPSAALNRPPGTIAFNVEAVAGSRAAAYRYLDDNRKDLFIPDHVDVVVEEIFRADKLAGRDNLPQPTQIILQYTWREEIILKGKRFGQFEGQTTSMPCGATLVLNENGAMLHWARKPGSEPSERAIVAAKRNKAAPKVNQAALEEVERGKARRKRFCHDLARRIAAGEIGSAFESGAGLVAGLTPPFLARSEQGSVRFELAPHFSIFGTDDDPMGARQWQASS